MNRFFLLLSCCFLMAAQGLAAPLFQPGSGVVAFTAYKPFADRPVNIYYHFPETADPATAQVLMLIPGAGRDAKPLLDAVRDKLDAVNVIAFSLEFPADTYPVREYQEVGIRDKDGRLKKAADRTVQLPDRIFEFIKAHSAIQAARYDMIGHSAGGQFIHRFLLFHDSPYVDRAVVGAPGWFTFPDPSQPYPYGLKDTDRASDEVIARFLGKKMILQVGALDTDRGGVLRKTPEADAQGINRLDRARTFFAYLRKEAQRLAVPFSWTYCEVPGVGHNSGQMAVYAMETLYCPGAGNSVFDVYRPTLRWHPRFPSGMRRQPTGSTATTRRWRRSARRHRRRRRVTYCCWAVRPLSFGIPWPKTSRRSRRSAAATGAPHSAISSCISTG